MPTRINGKVSVYFKGVKIGIANNDFTSETNGTGLGSPIFDDYSKISFLPPAPIDFTLDWFGPGFIDKEKKNIFKKIKEWWILRNGIKYYS